MSSEPTKSANIIELDESDIMRNFLNPICKQTYKSLPRIYGKKKKANILYEQPNQNSTHKKYRIKTEIEESKTSLEKRRKQFLMGQNQCMSKNNIKCRQKNCVCSKNRIRAQMDRVSFTQREKQRRKIALPKIPKFDLKDFSSDQDNVQKQLFTSKNQVQNDHKQTKDYRLSLNSLEQKNINNIKYKRRFKTLANGKYNVQEQQQEYKNTVQLNKRADLDTDKRSKNDSQDKTSQDSFSLSSFIFQNAKNPNTNYHLLNKSQKSQQQKLNRSRVKSIQSNGLFRIPEEPQYKPYLKGYRCLNPKFSIKNLVYSSNFKILKEDNEVYFGEVNEKSEKDGTGILVSERQIFQGQFSKNNKILGYQRNGDGVYQGGFLNGLRSGEGKFVWNNGQIFEGNFEVGMKNGFGIWKSPKGQYYQGSWKNNRQNGEGMFKHRISTYKGEFVNFLKHGHGVEIFANGDKYTGMYENGKPHGKGKYDWHEGSYYVGLFVKGLRQGKGKWIDENGTVYDGQFKKDSKDGYGIQIYKGGQKFEGYFKQGIRQTGILIDQEGNRIQIKNQ